MCTGCRVISCFLGVVYSFTQETLGLSCWRQAAHPYMVVFGPRTSLPAHRPRWNSFTAPGSAGQSREGLSEFGQDHCEHVGWGVCVCVSTELSGLNGYNDAAANNRNLSFRIYPYTFDIIEYKLYIYIYIHTHTYTHTQSKK